MSTVVMAVGVFDLLHAGHLHYLEQAKSLGDKLVVVVAHDETVRKRKHEPITNHNLRARMVSGLKPVDSSIIGNPPEFIDKVGLGVHLTPSRTNGLHAMVEKIMNYAKQYSK